MACEWATLWHFPCPSTGEMVSLSLHDYAPAPTQITAGGDATYAERKSLPNERSLLCLVTPAPRLPKRAGTAPGGGIASVLLHVVIITTVVLVSARSGSVAASPEATSTRQSLQLPRLVFLQMPGPGGGGGGGGKRQPTPPSRAQAVGRDRLTVQVAKPVVASEQWTDAVTPVQQVVLDAMPLASGTMFMAGLPDAAPSLPLSQGPGFGGGVGQGSGTGIGSGTGPGMGPGSGGGFGGGAYRVGPGVVAPTLLTQVRPNYTTDALRLKIQGTVMLEVVVGRDGVPTAIRVTRSLDAANGLDKEAIAAVREWRFTPGRVGDRPVDVLVTIFVDFRIV